jgi:hypothetical protein
MWHISHRMMQINTQALQAALQLWTIKTAACEQAAVVGLI